MLNSLTQSKTEAFPKWQHLLPGLPTLNSRPLPPLSGREHELSNIYHIQVWVTQIPLVSNSRAALFSPELWFYFLWKT